MKKPFVNYLLTILLLLLVTAVSQAQNRPLLVGFGTSNITADTSQVLDSLRVKAVIFKQGRVEFALVECDILSVPNDLVSSIKEKAAALTRIPSANICIAATHTHMASGYKDLSKAVPEALMQAKNNLQPVTFASGVGREFTVAHNRRYFMKDGSVVFNPMFLNPDIVRPAGPIDPDVSFILFYDATGKPVSVLTNFALHLDVAKEYGAVYQKTGSGSRNAVSADYPFWLEQNFRELYGDHFNSLFLTGCCGNINHFDFSKPGPQSGYLTKSKSIGDSLFKSIKRALPNSSKERPVLAFQSKVIEVPLQQLTEQQLAWAKAVSTESVSKKSEEMTERARFLTNVRKSRYLSLNDYRKRGFTESLPLQVQAVKLSDETAIVTLPGEMFVEFGMYIKNNSPFKNTLVVEMANHSIAYVPTKLAFREGEYEVENSRLAPGGGELLVNTAIELLNKLK